ncbi:MAG: hypothetical protein FWG39_03125 [Alphaproteobacteria bacterium]|nr:hypothetical protein [Alphaproteobacteria bacterium]
MKRIIYALCLMPYAFSANANWERYQPWYDDGVRMTVSLRGGYAMGNGKIKNELGGMAEPYVEDNFGNPVPITLCQILPGECPENPTFLGDAVILGDIPADKNYESRGFAGGASVGFTVPNRPQIRIEADWLHISKASFNAAPLFTGTVMPAFIAEWNGSTYDVVGASPSDMFDVGIGAVRTNMDSDVISAMIYYDFFEGVSKRPGTLVPYVGAGMGYASTRTVLELLDLYGNLSAQMPLEDFGAGGPNPDPLVTGTAREFYTSSNTSGNIAGTLTAGVAYGIMEGLFLDFSARLTYIPKVTYSLNNEADTSATNSRTADIFSIESLMYTTFMAGLRFEF